jgi:hypothetical protein
MTNPLNYRIAGLGIGIAKTFELAKRQASAASAQPIGAGCEQTFFSGSAWIFSNCDLQNLA